jgi:mono/diheme cytochrome c family protein
MVHRLMASATRSVLALLIVAVSGLATSGQAPERPTPPLVIESMLGRDLFEFYCAPCHGRDGKGEGPVVPALKVRPPDLTTIALRNRGTFPTERVSALVTGDATLPTPAHGSKDMPVWGPIFRALDPRSKANEIRVSNIVAHLESMQVKKTARGIVGDQAPARGQPLTRR